MLPMDSAPMDGTRILIKTVTFGWDTDICQHVATGDQWIEARWHKGALDSEPRWQEWCGNDRTQTTSWLMPLGWAPRPD